MNLHDWIDELCDVLDLETEVDEGLLNDLATLAHDNVEPTAGPVTTYLVGFAAGRRNAGPVGVERLATSAQELAETWDRPPGQAGEEDGDDDVVDDVPLDLSDIDDDDADETEDAGLVARR